MGYWSKSQLVIK